MVDIYIIPPLLQWERCSSVFIHLYLWVTHSTKMASKGMVPIPLEPPDRRVESLPFWNLLKQPYIRAFHQLSKCWTFKYKDYLASPWKEKLSKKAMNVMSPSVCHFSIELYQCKYANLWAWSHRRGQSRLSASVQHIAVSFFLRDMNVLFISSVKGYRSAIKSLDLATSTELFVLFRS